MALQYRVQWNCTLTGRKLGILMAWGPGVEKWVEASHQNPELGHVILSTRIRVPESLTFVDHAIEIEATQRVDLELGKLVNQDDRSPGVEDPYSSKGRG
jgi:hypothetical protein